MQYQLSLLPKLKLHNARTLCKIPLNSYLFILRRNRVMKLSLAVGCAACFHSSYPFHTPAYRFWCLWHAGRLLPHPLPFFALQASMDSFAGSVKRYVLLIR